MISEERFFGNIFDVPGITPARLALFAKDAIARFQANDTAHRFSAQVEAVVAAAAILQAELSDVSGALATQKATTLSVDEVLDRFKKTMQDENLELTAKLGGPKTAAYMEFYPQGKNEYSKITKTQMPVLAGRVAKMASKYAEMLGASLTDTLKGFQDKWEMARENQQGQKGTVGENRAERSGSLLPLQLALLAAAHAVGGAFPGDVAACKAYFDFSLLDAHHHPSLDRP